MRFGFDVKPDEMAWLPRWRRWDGDDDARSRSAAPAGERGEVALTAWVTVSLVGVVLGLALAKYAQAWARDVLHPGAVWGVFIILASVGLTLVAGSRYIAREVGLVEARRASRALVTLSTLLVLALAWAALNIVWLAGWAFPPARAQ
jgi:hypothetical protein